MSESEALYHELCSSINGAVKSQLFGKPCYKIGTKAFVCFYEEEMVFKLTDEAHGDALSLDGSTLFDPSKKGRPMKEWVQVPFDYNNQWQRFASSAFEYVKSQTK